MKQIAVGQKFKLVNCETGQIEDTFILAQSKAFQVCLISLSCGNRWDDAKEVENVDKLTEKEFDSISYIGEENLQWVQIFD